MKQMKRITLRLSLENPTDKKIADFLANIDKNKYHTVNNAIKTILYSVISDADRNAAETISKAERSFRLLRNARALSVKITT